MCRLPDGRAKGEEVPAADGGRYKIEDRRRQHFSAAAGNDESEIVELLAGAEFLNRVLNMQQKLFRRVVRVRPNRFDEASFTEFIARGIGSFSDAVGVDHDEVAWREGDVPGDALPIGKQANHSGSGGEALEGAVAAEQERGVVTTIGVFKFA